MTKGLLILAMGAEKRNTLREIKTKHKYETLNLVFYVKKGASSISPGLEGFYPLLESRVSVDEHCDSA